MDFRKKKKMHLLVYICRRFNDYIFEYSEKLIFFREKYKISHCSLPNLQLDPCGIKMNSKVPAGICQKNNLEYVWNCI